MAPRSNDTQNAEFKGSDSRKVGSSSGAGKGKSSSSDAPSPSEDRFAALLAPAPSTGGRTSTGGKGGKGKYKSDTSESPGKHRGSPKEKEESPLKDDEEGQGPRARDEVFAEIRALLDNNTTLQLADFDYRIRQHLHALLGSGGRQRLHEALATLNTATSKKTRADVKNWPAYLWKLMKKVDDDIAWKDREARARARVEKAANKSSEAGSPGEKSIGSASADSPGTSNSPSKKAARGEPLDEDEDWLAALDNDKDSWLNNLGGADAGDVPSPVSPPGRSVPSPKLMKIHGQAPTEPPSAVQPSSPMPTGPPAPPSCPMPTEPPPPPSCPIPVEPPKHQPVPSEPPTRPAPRGGESSLEHVLAANALPRGIQSQPSRTDHLHHGEHLQPPRGDHHHSGRGDQLQPPPTMPPTAPPRVLHLEEQVLQGGGPPPPLPPTGPPSLHGHGDGPPTLPPAHQPRLPPGANGQQFIHGHMSNGHMGIPPPTQLAAGRNAHKAGQVVAPRGQNVHSAQPPALPPALDNDLLLKLEMQLQQEQHMKREQKMLQREQLHREQQLQREEHLLRAQQLHSDEQLHRAAQLHREEQMHRAQQMHLEQQLQRAQHLHREEQLLRQQQMQREAELHRHHQQQRQQGYHGRQNNGHHDPRHNGGHHDPNRGRGRGYKDAGEDPNNGRYAPQDHGSSLDGFPLEAWAAWLGGGSSQHAGAHCIAR